MKIAYIANVRMPTDKAHGVQIMKTCEAFIGLGHQVILVVPRRHNMINEKPFTYYGMQDTFQITYLPTWDLVHWGAGGFIMQYATFAMMILFSSTVRNADTVYGRDEVALWAASLVSRRKVVWESHVGAWNFFARRLARKAHSIVTITQGLKDFYAAKGLSLSKIMVAPDGVDLKA
ncbi:glycosyltransferase, partial [Candidatus Kaiserbacteria bacterium]|nr:glycosyltransferase [Candidatus Kaiserbacteria bacterium]